MKESPQFLRTDKAIINALISLLHRKPFEKITVQDILDETPVTRATFYAHYRDKYEIAEKMLDRFLEQRRRIRQELPYYSYTSLESLRQDTQLDRAFTSALLKIHTEKVDFRRLVASQIEEEYIRTSDSPTRELEARIYAQACVELYLIMLEQNWADIPMERIFEILLPVSIGLLQLPHAPDIYAYLAEQIARQQAARPTYLKKQWE